MDERVSRPPKSRRLGDDNHHVVRLVLIFASVFVLSALFLGILLAALFSPADRWSLIREHLFDVLKLAVMVFGGVFAFYLGKNRNIM